MTDSTCKCIKCGHTTRVRFATCLRGSWPVCCGLTMTLSETTADIAAAVGAAVTKT